MDQTQLIQTIASIILLLLTGFFGKQWGSAKESAKKGVAIAEQKSNQAITVANKIIAAAEDDMITPEEVQDIALSLKDFLPKQEE